MKAIYDQVLGRGPTTQSAHLGQWSEDWTASFQKDGFATMLCPGWMLGVIEGNAAGVEGWDIADVFPGGGGNWGGSFLTVPAMGAQPGRGQEAGRVADRPGAADQGVQGQGHLPEPGRGADLAMTCCRRRTRSSTTRRPARSWPTGPRP